MDTPIVLQLSLFSESEPASLRFQLDRIFRTAKRVKLRNLRKDCPEGKQYCVRCFECKYKSEFYSNKRTPGKISLYCSECASKESKLRYPAKKKEISSLRKEVKEKCVNMLGGCCSRCGYKEFLSGLDFHHISNNKENGISEMTTGASRTKEKWSESLELELKKCILLCSNCHRAFHSGEWK